MTPEYMASLSSYGNYSPLASSHNPSMSISELLSSQENGLGIMDSLTWNGEQTGIGGFMNQSLPQSTGGLFGNFFDTTAGGVTSQGWGGMALGAASALGNAYLGMKQYGLAKDTLKHNKQMFAKNFDAQKRTTNASLEDRQRARIASNAGAYESVGSYMKKNGIV